MPGAGTSSSPEAPAGPAVEPVPCPACERAVDPLRAGHVAIFEESFHYFCDLACREKYLSGARRKQSQRPSGGSRASEPAELLDESVGELPPLERATDELDELQQGLEQGAGPEAEATGGKSDVGTLLLLSATVAGVLAVALALIGSSSTVFVVRLAVACLGVGLLLARAMVVTRDPSDPHPAAIVGPGVAAAVVAVAARFTNNPMADEAAVLTGLIVVSTGTSIQLVEHLRREAVASLGEMRDALDAPARRLGPNGYAVVPASSLRPGEEILIDTGEMAPTDAAINAGHATVLPWLGAQTATHKQAGDALVAGARLISGRVRATVTWTGMDRAWLRTTLDPTRGAHVLAPISRFGRAVVERGALVSGALAALAAFVNNAPTASVLLAALAGHVAIASTATASIPAFHVLRGLLGALRRGITYESAGAWDRAARTSAVVFPTRGTMLLGEPQVVEIVGVGASHNDRLLSLAAGAGTSASDPISAAVHRAARDRAVRADAVRSPTSVAGLGVTAVTSNGEALCVGSRALMLREHISMASVESKLAELESLGRTVLLIAVAGRLIGFIALQDGLRPGARAAVQYLLDAGIEPVLLSGDARETCEAIAKSLDIEHVRPEVLPSERAAEVRRIAESGATVAVVGRPAQDEAALGAADVAVALDSAGSTLGVWAIALANDDVRDAARSLVMARRARAHARAAFIVSFSPGVAGGLAIAFGLLPAAYAPLVVLLGSIAAHLYARGVDGPERALLV